MANKFERREKMQKKTPLSKKWYRKKHTDGEFEGNSNCSKKCESKKLSGKKLNEKNSNEKHDRKEGTPFH